MSLEILRDLERLARETDELDALARQTERPYADRELATRYYAARRRLLRELEVAGVFGPMDRTLLAEVPAVLAFHDAATALHRYHASPERARRSVGPAPQSLLDANISLDWFRCHAGDRPSQVSEHEWLAECELQFADSIPSFDAGRRFVRLYGKLYQLWFRTEARATPVLYRAEAESARRSEPLGLTLSGPDLGALTAAVIDAAPFARGVPSRTTRKLVEQPSTPDWRQRLLAPGADGLSVEWGEGRIGRNPTTVSVSLPDVPLEPQQILELVAELPFELAVLPSLDGGWVKHDYFSPAIGPDHALLGWGMMFRGAGHARHLVSRRWLEHGPFKLWRGPRDTTFVQFHELDIDNARSLEQARPAHEWIVNGFLRADHRYRNEIQGLYTADDQLLRIVINDRELPDRELRDACAARRDRRDDARHPIANIAYIFVDEREARANLERLWLRELECRFTGPDGERRLDERYQPTDKRPPWVAS